MGIEENDGLFHVEGTAYAFLVEENGISSRTGEKWRSRVLVIDTDEVSGVRHRQVVSLTGDLCDAKIELNQRVHVAYQSYGRHFTSSNGQKVIWHQENTAKGVWLINPDGTYTQV